MLKLSAGTDDFACFVLLYLWLFIKYSSQSDDYTREVIIFSPISYFLINKMIIGYAQYP